MPQFSLRRPKDKLLYTVAKDMHLHTGASSPLESTREGGFIAAHGSTAPRGRVERTEGVLLWICGAILACAFIYFAYRCYEFIRT